MWEVYPFILKAYHLFREDKKQLESIFHALEIIAFRDKLVKTRADFASRLNEVLKNFTKVEDLENGLKAICTEEKWYWRDDAVSDALDNIYIDNDTIIPYILMRYENHLRANNAKEKGYSFSLEDIKEITIEHIAPQTENGKRLASGYDKYDKEFYEECYLHCIGNLLLIDKSHNSSLGNKPFKNKLASYENTPLAQQREIKDFVKDDKWDKDAISARHEKIEKFVFETWSFA